MPISEILATILTKRGIAEGEQESFLSPDFDRDIHDGMLMKGMDVAVTRIADAIAKKQRIGIFGDYDADGVPATALLVRAFKRLGVEVFPTIPTRAEGYGLNMEAAKRLIAQDLALLITVDNGTVSEQEIAALKQAGVDTIVCDHHEPQEGHMADAALAILNPKQKGDRYPFRELCGCAIGWKLMIEVYKALGVDPAVLKWELDLVAFSTIADMVPLVGENRVLAVYGLKVLRKSRNKGLLALASVSGLKSSELSSGNVSFQLAPRINASSRMHRELLPDGTHAALGLLLSEDDNEAYSLAEYVHLQNQERQALLEKSLLEAEAQAKTLAEDLCLVLFNPDWSSGVIGLLAGRVLEIYQRPVIALAIEDGTIKGSVRSVDGVDAVSMLSAGERYLGRYGGHGKAAGLSMGPDGDIEGFRKALNGWMAKRGVGIAEMAESCQRQPDLSLQLSGVDLSLAHGLKGLEPFGIGFPTPLFETVCEISSLRKVGAEGQHLSMRLRQGGEERKGIAFRQGAAPVSNGQLCRAYFTVVAEVWNGNESASCQVQRLVPITTSLD